MIWICDQGYNSSEIKCSIISIELTIDLVHQFLIGQFLLLVVDHRELVGLQLILLELGGFADEVGELDYFSALAVVFNGFPADI